MYLVQQPSPTRKLGGVAFVVALHGVLVYALVNGLGHKVVEVLRAPLQTEIIQEIKPPPPAVKPPPPPKLTAPPPPYIPPPEVKVNTPPPQAAIAAVTAAKPTEPPPPARVEAPPAPAVKVPPVIDAAKSCRPPEYPATSRRLEETGVVTLLFLIGTDGSVLESKVENSSGHARLDEAALAALSKCKFKPGTTDGKPEESWARLKYNWKIE